ncbi:MFS transporter [Mycolicibacterium palauense]|uniref:MFS transporter n=1 Tax=Mycolicibacterium palauense TaxID=2034511 RepID=UPI000BFEEF7A|nr:MFS transporter [Mycolicibacterium palauense]
MRPLAIPNMRLFLASQLIVQLGNWTRMVAAGLLVLQLTDSGLLVGLVALAQFAPMLVLGPWAGVLADRFHRLTLLLVVGVFNGLVAVVFAVAVAVGAASSWVVLLLSAAGGVITALENPPRRAFVADLVPDEVLPAAVALNATVMTVAKLLTPALTAFVITTAGMSWCFALSAVTFVPQLALLLRIRRPDLRPWVRVPREPGQLRQGLAYVARTPAIRSPLVLLTALGLFSTGAHQVLLPLFAQRELAGDEGTYTVLFAALGVGSVVGSVLSARPVFGSTRALNWLAVAFGVANTALALSPTLVTATVAAALVGVLVMMIVTVASAQVQVAAEPAMRGRVSALLSIVFLCTGALGNPVIGLLADVSGTRVALLAGAAVAAVTGGVLLAARGLRPARVHAVGVPAPEECR